MSTGFKVFLAFVGIVVVSVGIWATTAALSPVTGKVEAYKQINSANNQLAQYDHFFTLDGDIRSQAANATAAKVQVDTYNKQYPPSPTESFSVTEQRNNLQANATGLLQICTSNVNQYNNDAASYTKGQFMDSKLPWNYSAAVCTDPSLLPPAPQK